MNYFPKNLKNRPFNNFKLFVFFISILMLCNHIVIAQKLNKSSELIKMYRDYRLVQQKKTNWVDSLDNWVGKFHKIMSEVSDTLGKPIYYKKEIINLLGKPDLVINRKNQIEFNDIYLLINNKNRIQGSEEYLIYKWRGYRDFIYFYVKCNKVQKSNWYYSWE